MDFISPTQLTEHALDGSLLRFDRRTGLNVLIRGETTAALRRVAPRVLQIGLLTPCNLTCAFCYRDTTAPSRLTAPFLLDLLGQAATWGVLEVTFGGGEPLLFPGFPKLLCDLHRTTPLGINFTTNGTLLTRNLLDEIHDATGEIRLSAYPDNHYRRTLRLLRGVNAGVNWLVTPENVGLIEPYVNDFLRLGAQNVLLLGYKGHETRFHLRQEHIEQLRGAVERLHHLPLRLDVCWYPYLSDLPHLFARADCQAGDEFLVITPDRAIQPCSFHHERIPFATFEELRTIYHEMRLRRPPAQIGGCTRRLFVTPRSSGPEPTQTRAWTWQARAANNSGDWTIIGRFSSETQAARVAQGLQELARRHEAFLASEAGRIWVEEHDYEGTMPTPPLQDFGQRHGFDWSQDGDGLWWEEDGAGAPVLTAGVVGDAVVVYHPYCMGLPEDPFRTFFRQMGAQEFGEWQYDRPRVIVTAEGENAESFQLLQAYFSMVNEAEYATHVTEVPPWGEQATGPRVQDDEDCAATLDEGPHKAEQDGAILRLSVRFQNTFAGAVALERWLQATGYRHIVVQIENALAPIKETTIESE